MLSILIPTYNYNIVPLVEDVFEQASKCQVAFEILVYDDGSNSILNIENESINLLENCFFKELPRNIGRSSIRNLLGNDAKYDYLIFIDAGTIPLKKNFIKNYITVKNKTISVGGMTYGKKPLHKNHKLRWLYTKKRESTNGLHSSNFLIKKSLFQTNIFDESIKKYGCEDVLFFNNLIENNYKIHKINNPVIHAADDDANTFVKKTEYAIENLIQLIDEDKLSITHYNISKIYKKLNALKLDKFTAQFYQLLKPLLIRNFNSNHPSILLFDFYRLGFYCSLKTKY
ncbi:glycosyltransferase family 2 protein [Mariniflexile sp. AS56]|uniref:glycosyltransferase family 2 protein n=1 Tax=Mariniflexile sp. AS56 TaxID=3063957 RepID=UPI0026F1B13E|nr:glycosyltransferase [Mariniflexile sp. AS56]MDO7174083.1 glycosyltransferase [Mariniflexile sp. AS56]